MITVAAVLARLPGLDEQRLQMWIAEEWVRPIRQGNGMYFAEIDVARINLILELQELEVGNGAMPVVLSCWTGFTSSDARCSASSPRCGRRA